MRVRQLGGNEWLVAREIRLDALAGSPPGTFASTFEVASRWDEPQWRQWMGTRLLFVAERDGRVVGSAGIVTKSDDRPPVVVSVWVNPSARGTGASDLLLAATIDWTRAHGHEELRLWVVEGNHHAESLYLRTGFDFTGCKQRCAEDDPRLESEMFIAVMSDIVPT
ncbi:GNAT family N-acetyltransferase [Nocardia pseudovaccinii]|uniref:GNAT family N-acetyltransferase n=1 Tax=Nocardia pseudovaccinii TaxID=189540 RepID=UPI000B10059B|nr:GNAT family N-acetyltransferase [Nocardia pseudovaccinii]